MKNMQNSNSGFILTSLSFNNNDKSKYASGHFNDVPGETKKVIMKYDYCLPPEEKENTFYKK